MSPGHTSGPFAVAGLSGWVPQQTGDSCCRSGLHPLPTPAATPSLCSVPDLPASPTSPGTGALEASADASVHPPETSLNYAGSIQQHEGLGQGPCTDTQWECHGAPRMAGAAVPSCTSHCLSLLSPSSLSLGWEGRTALRREWPVFIPRRNGDEACEDLTGSCTWQPGPGWKVWSQADRLTQLCTPLCRPAQSCLLLLPSRPPGSLGTRVEGDW